MGDGTCTAWPDGEWLDCCLQHDCDCGTVWPLPCNMVDNLELLDCVLASSWSVRVEYPGLVRANAVLMYAGVTVLNPVFTVLKRFGGFGAAAGMEEDGYL